MIQEKKLAADLLCMRAKEKVQGEENLKRVDIPKLRATLEVDTLYYWILSRLYAKMESYRPARRVVTIIITGSIKGDNNKVLLRHGDSDEYLPYYVEGKEFFNVIKDTLQIYEENVRFNCDYFQSSDDSCEFWISFQVG